MPRTRSNGSISTFDMVVAVVFSACLLFSGYEKSPTGKTGALGPTMTVEASYRSLNVDEQPKPPATERASSGIVPPPVPKRNNVLRKTTPDARPLSGGRNNLGASLVATAALSGDGPSLTMPALQPTPRKREGLES